MNEEMIGTRQPGFLEDDAPPVELPEMIDSIVEETNKKAVDRFEDFQDVVDKLRILAIKKTRARDWVKFGDTAFLMASGAERLISVGMIRAKAKKIWREDFPEGDIPYAYMVSGDISIHLPGNIVPIEFTGIEGGRGCDKFFRDGAKAQHRDVNPLHIRGAALSAWTRRAVTTILGLRGIPWDEVSRVLGTAASKSTTVPIRQGAPAGADTGETLGRRHNDILKKLKEIFGDDYQVLAKWALKGITQDNTKDPPWEGKEDIHQLSDKGAGWVLVQLGKMPSDFVVQLAKDTREVYEGKS